MRKLESGEKASRSCSTSNNNVFLQISLPQQSLELWVHPLGILIIQNEYNEANEDTWREGVIGKYIARWGGFLCVWYQLLKPDKNCEIKINRELVSFHPLTSKKMEWLAAWGFTLLPFCVAWNNNTFCWFLENSVFKCTYPISFPFPSALVKVGNQRRNELYNVCRIETQSRDTHPLRNIEYLHIEIKQSVQSGQLDQDGAGKKEKTFLFLIFLCIF